MIELDELTCANVTNDSAFLELCVLCRVKGRYDVLTDSPLL